MSTAKSIICFFFEHNLPKPSDATNNGHHLGRHLGFYQELEIRLKPREMIIFCALHENKSLSLWLLMKNYT